MLKYTDFHIRMLKEEQTKMKIEKDSATDRVKNCEYKAAGGPMEEGRE